MSKNISSFFIKREIIPYEDFEVYAYSFEIVISSALSFVTLAIIAILSGTVHYTALFLLGFIPLRLVAGGYHAKSHFRCFFILIVSYSVFLLLLYWIPDGIFLPVIIMAAVSIVLVFVFAPCPDSNKPVTMQEELLFKKLSRITVICCTAAICVLSVFIASKNIGFSLASGVFTASVSLLASRIKTKITITHQIDRKGG